MQKKDMNTMNTQAKIGVLLVNLGTPDSPSVADVRKYLREFLMDARVIDIPFLSRWLLVNLIIAPFRAPKSAKIYQEVWTAQGSPLKVYGEALAQMLQSHLGADYEVVLGMRYQSPSIPSALNQLKDKGLEKIIVIPLFPQYASATTGSVHDKVMEIVKTWQIIPEIAFVQSFFEHPQFIQAFAEIGKKYLQQTDFDHIIFSYHGLPERQIRKGDATGTCLVEAAKKPECAGEANCCATLHAHNRACYRAQCFETTRLLAQELAIAPENYTVCFQSRLGRDPWIKPYTEDVIKDLVKKGKKRVLAFSPSFVADCLETTIEIGEEYKEVFLHEGGEHWQMVESLNDSALWVETVAALVAHYAPLLPKVQVSSAMS
ncbi:MAG: ferrochelatase [Microscillaceae bacterium]|jgi:ferrochelatase|nr:ferrochelatase [Microscillaceae bacterium]